MPESDLKKVYQTFSECWKFYKRFADVQSTDEYWECMTSEGDQLAKRFGNGRFVRDLVLAVITELERRGKEAKGNEAI